jgi:hypothetical protein
VLAEIARCGADVGHDERMAELDERDLFHRPAARLIEAVLQFAGRSISEMGSAGPLAPSDGSALSAEHLEYRQLVAQIDRFNDPEHSVSGSEAEHEALIASLMERESALARQIWAKPALTPADVLLRGEIALHNENSLTDVLEEPVAYYDEYACAQLIQAVVSVGRQRHG